MTGTNNAEDGSNDATNQNTSCLLFPHCQTQLGVGGPYDHHWIHDLQVQFLTH